MNKGRYALYFIGTLYILIACLQIFSGKNPIEISINAFVGFLFVGVSVWSYWQPFVALITGLSTYILMNLIMIYDKPASIFDGLIIKAIIITALLYSIKKAKELKDEQKTIKEDLIDQL